MLSKSRTQSPLLVSFSGIDGAGKTTQIDALSSTLQRGGVSVRVVAFWNEIASLTRLRESSSHILFKGDKGVGTPNHPINRRDKNIRSAYLSFFRFFLYLLDAISLRWKVAEVRRSGARVVIFDRYVYDELANFSFDNRATRFLLSLLLKITPRPDIAYLLDAEPAAAYRRKPEYPLDFLHCNRASFLTTSKLADMTVIPPLSSTEAAKKVAEAVSQQITLLPKPTGETTLGEPLSLASEAPPN